VDIFSVICGCLIGNQITVGNKIILKFSVIGDIAEFGHHA
jgi:hypothetical protein